MKNARLRKRREYRLLEELVLAAGEQRRLQRGVLAALVLAGGVPGGGVRGRGGLTVLGALLVLILVLVRCRCR